LPIVCLYLCVRHFARVAQPLPEPAPLRIQTFFTATAGAGLASRHDRGHASCCRLLQVGFGESAWRSGQLIIVYFIATSR